ncbi:MAG: O-antigen ligase family protein [Verrucomicrobiales bacterium]|nr:O-antigen ligase family protein [Verrucomicrobiales bacterium]
MQTVAAAPPPLAEQWRPAFAALAGLFLGLALLKFGNPAVLDRLVTAPTNGWEYLLQPWPLAWAYTLLILLAFIGLAVADWRLPTPRWFVALPALWLGWQLLAGAATDDTRLTALTLRYLVATTAGFYLGLFALAPSPRLTIFWGALLGCFVAVLVSGFQQRFGGLEAVRQHIYSQPGWENLPADYLKRLGTNRIFATLLYPNALAGAILLLLPPLAVFTWQRAERRMTTAARVFLTALFAAAALACLYWSKSKAGWLIAVVMGGLWLSRLPLARKLKLALAGLALVAGLTGFALRFSGYFEQGATSLGARMDYWRAAWITACARPLLGSGPGTFAASYRAIKPPEAEMALLAHNDYLQQASDSGFLGALLYLAFVGGSLVLLGRRATSDPQSFAIWLGLLGWALQSAVEFGLYVPAVGWAAFWLLGLLWGQSARLGPPGIPVDAKPKPA